MTIISFINMHSLVLNNRCGVYLLLLSHLLQGRYRLCIFIIVHFLIHAWAVIHPLFNGVSFEGNSYYSA